MTEKRYSHDGVVIEDHLKKDLIDIDGRDDLLELAEYVDRLQEENEQLKKSIKRQQLSNDECSKYIEEVVKENEQLNEDVQRRKENEKILIKTANDLNELIDRLEKKNEQLKQENKELHRLNHEEVESWSDEKKQMIAEFSNLMFGDKINDRKQKNNWKNKY